MNDTEMVRVWQIDPPMDLFNATLYIGLSGLPCLQGEDVQGEFDYTTGSFPSNWVLRTIPPYMKGELLSAWQQIQGIMEDLATWQRRHDSCGKEDVQNEEEAP